MTILTLLCYCFRDYSERFAGCRRSDVCQGWFLSVTHSSRPHPAVWLSHRYQIAGNRVPPGTGSLFLSTVSRISKTSLKRLPSNENTSLLSPYFHRPVFWFYTVICFTSIRRPPTWKTTLIQLQRGLITGVILL